MKNLILLHGALGSEKQFGKLKRLLSDQFRVYSLDFEGHGERNSTAPFSMDLFSDNLDQFIHEKQIQGSLVFGYSMGGYVALHLARKKPELLGDIMTLGSKLKWSPEIAKSEVKMLNPEIIQEKVKGFASYLGSLHNDWVDNMNRTTEMMIELGNGKSLGLDQFAEITNTVYMGVGDADQMVSKAETQEVATVIPNATFYEMEQTEHPLPKVDMNRLADRIAQFLG